LSAAGICCSAAESMQVIAGSPAQFGAPHLLELGGLGIRSMTPYRNGYVLVGGSFDGTPLSQLYYWDGASSTPTIMNTERLPANPEALSVIEEQNATRLFVVSDDGTEKVGDVECKKVKDSNTKVFRAYELTLSRRKTPLSRPEECVNTSAQERRSR
jgi:hypothetical protein